MARYRGVSKSRRQAWIFQRHGRYHIVAPGTGTSQACYISTCGDDVFPTHDDPPPVEVDSRHGNESGTSTRTKEQEHGSSFPHAELRRDNSLGGTDSGSQQTRLGRWVAKEGSQMSKMHGMIKRREPILFFLQANSDLAKILFLYVCTVQPP
jgi:hypothetical protein